MTRILAARLTKFLLSGSQVGHLLTTDLVALDIIHRSHTYLLYEIGFITSFSNDVNDRKSQLTGIRRRTRTPNISVR